MQLVNKIGPDRDYYDFPEIRNISDVRRWYQGAEEFIEKVRDDHIIVDYVYSGPNTFPHYDSSPMIANHTTIYRRECRGIIFDKASGNIIRRSPHKFFNLNERPEVRIENIVWKDFMVLVKEDGTHISPYFSNGRIIWGTMAGETDFSHDVQKFVNEHPQYEKLAYYLLSIGYTPNFEWCSQRNRVVLEHKKSRLVLFGVRNIVTGQYLPYDEMVNFREYGIEVIHKIDDKRIADLIEDAKTVEQIEGWVVRFDSGHMIKIKADWYLSLHGVVTEIRFEKDVLELILNKRLDDAKPFLTPDRAEKFEQYEKEIVSGFHSVTKRIVEKFEANKGLARQEFWNAVKDDPANKFVMEAYTYAGDDPVYDYIFARLWEYVQDRLSSQTWVDSTRHLYDNKRFSF